MKFPETTTDAMLTSMSWTPGGSDRKPRRKKVMIIIPLRTTVEKRRL
jgi:hypothetical protein